MIDIYTELYKEATPSLDYLQLLKDLKEGKNISFDFNNYYLDREKYEGIVEKHIVKHKRLSERYKRALFFEAYLGHGPRSYKINNNE